MTSHQNKEGLEAAIDLLKSRDGENFDGEVHLTSAEAQAIAEFLSSLREENESLRNAFKMSAQESSEVIIALQQENERLRKERDGLQSALHGVRDNRDGLLREADAQLKIYRELLEAFVNVRDQFPESAKLIDTRFDGHQPISVTVTLDQFRAARTALSQEAGE